MALSHSFFSAHSTTAATSEISAASETSPTSASDIVETSSQTLSQTRLAKLTELLTQLQPLITTENKKILTFIFSGMSRPETFPVSQNFVVTQIQKAPADIQSLLNDVFNTLREEFLTKIAEFLSGNLFYECITNFLSVLKKPDDEYLEKKIIREMQVLSNKAIHLSLENINFAKNLGKLADAGRLYILNCVDLEAVDSILESINGMVDKERAAKQREDLSKLKDHLISLLFLNLRPLMNIFNIEYTEKHTLDSRSVSAVKSILSDAAARLILIKKDTLLKAPIDTYFLMYALWLQAKANFEVVIVLDEVRLKHAYLFLSTLPINKNPVTTNMDSNFASKLSPSDTWRANPLLLKNISDTLSENPIFAMILCPVAGTSFAKDFTDLPFSSSSEKELLDLYALYFLTPFLAGVWKRQGNFIAEFNFINLSYQKIKELKNSLQKDAEIQFILHRLLAKQLITFLALANDDIDSKSFDVCLVKNPVSNKFRHYYAAVCKQQYFYLAAETLLLCRPAGKTELDKDSENSLKKYLTEEEFEKYRTTDGIDGLFDFMLNKIDQQETLLNSQFSNIIAQIKRENYHLITHSSLSTPAIHSEQKSVNAERNFNELIEQAHIERKILLEEAAVKIEKFKHSHLQKRQIQSRNSMTVFSESKAEEKSSIELSVAARKYQQAGFLRYQDASPDKSIAIYLEIAAPYLQLTKGIKTTIPEMDFIQIVASLIELADCYIAMAVAETPSHLSKLTKQHLLKIIKLYHQAISYATMADICYAQEITARLVFYQEKGVLNQFEHLVLATRNLLNSATEDMKFVENKYRSLIKNFEKEIQLNAEGKLAAIEKMGGIELWRKNPSPRNYYLNVQEKLVTELNHAKSASQCFSGLAAKANPIKETFAYLCGDTPLPLLTYCTLTSAQETLYTEEKALQGKGTFEERLQWSAKNKELQNGKKSNQEILLILMDKGIDYSKAIIPYESPYNLSNVGS